MTEETRPAMALLQVPSLVAPVARWRLVWRTPWMAAGRFVVGLGLAALAMWALNGQRNELVGASSELGRLHVVWVLVAIACELLSFVSFGALQQRLLAASGVRVHLAFATTLSLAAGAIADSLPAGPAFASVFAFHQYRRKGADDVTAGWTLVATLVCAAFALAVLATIGAGVALKQTGNYDLAGVIVGVLVLTLLADAVVLQRRWLALAMVLVLQVSRALTGRPRRHGVEIVEDVVARLASVRLSRADRLATVGAGLGDWAFDCAALGFSFLAVGAAIPWKVLLLAYGAGQLAANLPITPGGLGVVEGTLTIALVAFGGAEVSTIAAVLCYRIVSFWGYLPVGWAAWLWLWFAERREDRAFLLAHPLPQPEHEATTALASPASLDSNGGVR